MSSADSVGPRVVGAILLILGLSAAVSVDVVKAGYGIKGDEATYVSMALSLAYDYDLAYQRRDLERFWSLYRSGPEGIFLKRGHEWHVDMDGSLPFVHVKRAPDTQNDRLRYGKALLYPVVAAPFVRIFGLNGFLVLHVLLLFGIGLCGYAFLAARAAPATALAFTSAFVFATVVPVYAVYLTSDLFNLALVFFAYFFWLHKEAAPAGSVRFVRGFGSDIIAAALIGLATYSKVLPFILIGPIVLLLWWRRRFLQGLLVAIVFVATTAALFGVNALTSGEFNYQGGTDRRTFYGHFPFDTVTDAGTSLTETEHSVKMTTNDTDAESVLDPAEFPNRFAHNIEYFFFGRHFGLVPYFFPGLVAIGLWLVSAQRFEIWRVLAFLALGGALLALLVFFPYTWSGGGGSPGNRYFLSLYPVLFFLIPAITLRTALFAWIGGALFTAHLVLNPFITAKFPNQPIQQGFARLLPVELTMATDLPVALDAQRSHVVYDEQPVVLLYFLDDNAYLPERDATGQRSFWVSANGRADIIVRTEQPLGRMQITADSPIDTVFSVSLGGPTQTVEVASGVPSVISVPAVGVRGLRSYAYLLSARSSRGFTPHLHAPDSADGRNLGVQLRLKAVQGSAR